MRGSAATPTRTRLVMDLTRTIEVAAFTLADPYRVVIDLPQVTFQLPARTGEQARGLIKAFRYGLVMQGGSRIVIDATGPVRIDKAFVLDAVGQPAGAARARSRRRSTARPSCATLALENRPRARGQEDRTRAGQAPAMTAGR